VSYTAEKIDFFTAMHRQLFGRAVPHVMLLHFNALKAATLDDLLRLFEERRYAFVAIEDAQRDTAFALETPAIKHGWMWGYRWAEALGKRANGSGEPV
jgi:peptidoglycan-N-acetylglucosamine deacetylase